VAGRSALVALALAAAAGVAAGALWLSRPLSDPLARPLSQPSTPRPAPTPAASTPAASTPAGESAVRSLFALNLDDADGRRRPVSEWRGKLLVVNFWATWCTPCIEEMPLLQRVADQYGARNVAVIGIGVDEIDKIREFRAKLAIRFPLLVAGFDGMDLARQLGNPEPVLPYTALVSPGGHILEQQSGRLQDAELRGWLAEHAND